MISVVICVKDRENERVQRCIDSVRWLKEVMEVIVVDYCSKTPIFVSCDKIIRYSKNTLFNKSHALNLGIKQANYPFIMTVDCDMILTPECLAPIPGLLREDCFIVNTQVKRIKIEDIGNWEKSWGWYEEEVKNINNRINSKANGGMQVFSKKWAEEAHGYDENLILLGGPDNDMYNRAMFSNNIMIDLNTPIYHQEHKLRKQQHLTEDEQEKANKIRLLKGRYLGERWEDELVTVPGQWGEDKPNQDKFIHWWDDYEGSLKKEKEKQKGFMHGMQDFIKKSGVEVSQVDVKW